MQSFNLHTHTFRCGHASGTDEQMILSAIEAGFKTLGFSDHMPYPHLNIPSCRMRYEHRQEYIQTMQTLKQKYQGQIALHYGYEAEYLSDYKELLQQLHQESEYLILGQHFHHFEANSIYPLVYDYDAYNNDDDVLYYTKQIEEACATGWFCLIAHPDYFMMGRRTFTQACKEAAERICDVSLKYNLPLEINLNGISYGKPMYHIQVPSEKHEPRAPYPFREFWEVAAKKQCPVCYGWDAHSPLAFQESHRLSSAEQILDGLSLNFIDYCPL